MNEEKTDLQEEVDRETSRPSEIDTLVAAFYNRDPGVRQRARESLVEIGKPAVEPLIEALREGNTQVQWDAAKALGQSGDPAVAPALASQLDHGDHGVRWLAAEGLVSIGVEALEPLLEVLAERGDEQPIRRGAHHVLEELGDRAPQEKVAPVLEALEGPDPDIEAPRAARVALYGSAGAPEELE